MSLKLLLWNSLLMKSNKCSFCDAAFVRPAEIDVLFKSKMVRKRWRISLAWSSRPSWLKGTSELEVNKFDEITFFTVFSTTISFENEEDDEDEDAKGFEDIEDEEEGVLC